MKYKFNKLVLGLVAIAALAASVCSVRAQLDSFAPERTLLFPGKAVFAAGTSYTNGPIDRIFFQGRSVVTICSLTNLPTSGSLTATVYGSPDTTNLTAVTSIGLVSSTTSFIITNMFYGGTNLYVTNLCLLPGTYTTPTVASSGYVGPYIANLQYTNTGAITITVPGTYQAAFNAQDQYRYLYVVFTTSATSGTNFLGTASFNGYPTQPLE